MNARFRNVDAIMPPATAVPTEWRASRPAPLANTSGMTPRMNASDVIRIGLSAKNGILVVEFAEQLRARGLSVTEAAVEAARIRLRPILMTSLAFILGVMPLVVAKGAGQEARHSVGTTV